MTISYAEHHHVKSTSPISLVTWYDVHFCHKYRI